MKTIATLLLIFFAFFAFFAFAEEKSLTPTTSYHSRLLPSDKIEHYTYLALSGNLEATEKLTTHYCAYGFNDKCFEWWRVYYENNPTQKTQYQLAKILLFRLNKDNENLARGIFWLKKSMNKDNPDDLALLDEAEAALKSQQHFKSIK